MKQASVLTITALLVVLLSACATQRPQPPPAGELSRLPWGANTLALDEISDPELVESLRNRLERKLRVAEGSGSAFEYNALTISGGGSRGAYSAGVLAGWSKTGERPEFDVVTGISTGALIATFAFLGPDYDDELWYYTRVSNEDIFTPRSRLAVLTDESFLDTTPLRLHFEELITDDVLKAVAREYELGRRLFIGTTNLDSGTFTIWDMGSIASSDHPERRQRYVDVILASAAFPVAFPPVHIPVETDEGTYYQMHVDGGLRENVFYFDFLSSVDVLLDEEDLKGLDFDLNLYILMSDKIHGDARYSPTDNSISGISGSSISTLLSQTQKSSLYRVWVQGLIGGITMHLTYIPREELISRSSLNFDNEEMKRLFELGYEGIQEGTVWRWQRPPTSHEELLWLLDPANSIDSLEGEPIKQAPQP